MSVNSPANRPSNAAHRCRRWNWIGGTLIVLAGVYLTRSLDAAEYLSLMIAGQLVLSVALDVIWRVAKNRLNPGFGRNR